MLTDPLGCGIPNVTDNARCSTFGASPNSSGSIFCACTCCRALVCGSALGKKTFEEVRKVWKISSAPLPRRGACQKFVGVKPNSMSTTHLPVHDSKFGDASVERDSKTVPSTQITGNIIDDLTTTLNDLHSDILNLAHAQRSVAPEDDEFEREYTSSAPSTWKRNCCQQKRMFPKIIHA